jgi:hypothetical protein
MKELPNIPPDQGNFNIEAKIAYSQAVWTENFYNQKLAREYQEPNQRQFLQTLHTLVVVAAEHDELYQIVYDKKPLTLVQKEIVVFPGREKANKIMNNCHVLSGHLVKHVNSQRVKPFYVQVWNYHDNLHVALAAREAEKIANQIGNGVLLEEYLHSYLNIAEGSVAFKIPNHVGTDMARIYAQIAHTKKQLE